MVYSGFIDGPPHGPAWGMPGRVCGRLPMAACAAGDIDLR